MTRSITILVSAYNKRPTLKKCVESLLSVTYVDKKILFIDGYSTDGSFEFLAQYRDKIDLRRVRGNYSTALNWALKKIDTEYVALTDADCVVSEDWIDKLLSGFDAKGVIATAGWCGTPESLTGFQKAIGLELESRFRKFPQYLLRAPTMNLCMKTDIARKVGFDEKIQVGIETDFGYRLTKLGKMKYIPEARVRHYHRTGVFVYFKQKRDQASGAVRTYIRHKDKIMGDHISTPTMMAQVPLGALIIIGLLSAIWYKPFLYLTYVSLAILVTIYIRDLFKITNRMEYFPYLILVFFTRTIAWTAGCAAGIIGLLPGRR